MKMYVVLKSGPRQFRGVAYDEKGKVKLRLTFPLPRLILCKDCKTYVATTDNGLCNYCADRPVNWSKGYDVTNDKRFYPNGASS